MSELHALLQTVARAIARVQLNGADPEEPAVRWNGTEMEPQDFPVWKDYLDEARAAIKAVADHARDTSLPPCELSYAGRTHEHPRFPSGDCVICGALCTEGCKHPQAVGGPDKTA